MSTVGTLDKKDWKKQGKSALVFFAPVLLMYISAILGVIQVSDHHFVWKDLVPSDMTMGAMVAWALMQLQGLLLKLMSDK